MNSRVYFGEREGVLAWLEESALHRALLFGKSTLSHPRLAVLPEEEYGELRALPSLVLNGTPPKVFGEPKDKVAFAVAMSELLSEKVLFSPKKDWLHTIQNMLYFRSALGLEQLEGHFSGQTAILCGAGFSTAEQIEQLREAKKKAVLFGVGTGTPLLDRLGVAPHIRILSDPNQTSASKALAGKSFHTPMITNAFVHPLMQYALCGPLLYAPRRENTLEALLAKRLGHTRFIEEGGPSSGTYAIAVAEFLGFEKILLVGYDMARKKGAKYPVTSLAHPAIPCGEAREMRLVGEEIETTYLHLQELSWMKGEKLYNASNHAWSCEGVVNSSLETLLAPLPETHPEVCVQRAFQQEAKGYSVEEVYTHLGHCLPWMQTTLRRVQSLEKIESKLGWVESLAQKNTRASEYTRLQKLLEMNSFLTPFLSAYEEFFSCYKSVWGAPPTFTRTAFMKKICSDFVQAVEAVYVPKSVVQHYSPPPWNIHLQGEKKALRFQTLSGTTLCLLAGEKKVWFDGCERLFSLVSADERLWYYSSGALRGREELLGRGLELYYPDGSLQRKRTERRDQLFSETGEVLFDHSS